LNPKNPLIAARFLPQFQFHLKLQKFEPREIASAYGVMI
jgi:hypothetical protein